MKKVYILLDIGGTQIKGGIADESGEIVGDVICTSAHAKESKEIILDNMATFIRQLMKKAKEAEIVGVGMAFPGPFDYEKGICLLDGLDKYESIYGVSIPEAMKKRVPELVNVKFCFLHDIEAFAVGESWMGEAKNDKKILCLCIGTGTGTAFVGDKVVLKKAENGVPENGWIYETPYKESKIDDYLSVRGLARICKEVMGEELDGKILYRLCQNQDEQALEVYRRFGDDLVACVLSFVVDFEPDAIVFGGQISKSFKFFGQKFQKECEKRNIKIYKEYETSVRAMQGLYINMTREG